MTALIDDMAIALARIAEEAELRTGSLDLSDLGLESLPETLFDLRHLRSLNLASYQLEESSTGLIRIDAQRERLKHLTLLRTLIVAGSDLASLVPLQTLQHLEYLNCSRTNVTDLAPLAGLSVLQQLSCWRTQVTDLTPLAGLSSLQHLDCSRTKVTDLTPLSGLSALQHLDCSECCLHSLPPSIVSKPSLRQLVLYNSSVPEVPPTGVLSQSTNENCLDRVRAHFADIAMNMNPLSTERTSPAIDARKQPPMGQEKSTMSEWYISYAWGEDKTPEGKAREKVVDDLCSIALADGNQILRDKEVLGLGDSISRFMRRIGTGDRIFVVLSDKYLRSPHCMLELSEIWRTSKQDREVFLQRVRIYALPDAKIWDPIDWTDWAIHWKEKYDVLDGRARQHGARILGEHGHRRLLQMQSFYVQVPDILGTLSDIVQPRSIEELREYGFRDDPD